MTAARTGPTCAHCGAPAAHETATIEDWAGGRVTVCEASTCSACQQAGPVAVINRTLACARCEPAVIAGLARMAAARKHAGRPLTRSDHRALDVTT